MVDRSVALPGSAGCLIVEEVRLSTFRATERLENLKNRRVLHLAYISSPVNQLGLTGLASALRSAFLRHRIVIQGWEIRTISNFKRLVNKNAEAILLYNHLALLQESGYTRKEHR